VVFWVVAPLCPISNHGTPITLL